MYEEQMRTIKQEFKSLVSYVTDIFGFYNNKYFRNIDIIQPYVTLS